MVSKLLKQAAKAGQSPGPPDLLATSQATGKSAFEAAQQALHALLFAPAFLAQQHALDGISAASPLPSLKMIFGLGALVPSSPQSPLKRILPSHISHLLMETDVVDYPAFWPSLFSKQLCSALPVQPAFHAPPELQDLPLVCLLAPSEHLTQHDPALSVHHAIALCFQLWLLANPTVPLAPSEPQDLPLVCLLAPSEQLPWLVSALSEHHAIAPSLWPFAAPSEHLATSLAPPELSPRPDSAPSELQVTSLPAQVKPVSAPSEHLALTQPFLSAVPCWSLTLCGSVLLDPRCPCFFFVRLGILSASLPIVTQNLLRPQGPFGKPQSDVFALMVKLQAALLDNMALPGTASLNASGAFQVSANLSFRLAWLCLACLLAFACKGPASMMQ